MNDNYKITVDWFSISDESLMIKCDDHCYDSICTTTRSQEYEHKSEIKELKQKLEEAKHANEIMRTDCKAMAEGLVRRENKIKELDAAIKELKLKIEDTNIVLENERHINDILLAQIEYCKRHGIWVDNPTAICSSLISRDKERGNK